MSGYRLTERASEDLITIYIQSHDLFGPNQADRYHDELTQLFGRLSQAPQIARLRTEHEPPVRAFGYKAHLIIYVEEPDGVVILRVRHGSEDWQADPLVDVADGSKDP